MPSIRPLCSALLVLAALAAAACAHAPVKPQEIVAAPAPAPVSTPEPAPTPTVDANALAQPDPVTGEIPAPFADLFDRVRAGFKLDDVDERAVDMQLSWFANHPDY